MHITLFKREFSSPVAWAVDGESRVHGFAEMRLYLTRQSGFHFSVRVSNKSFNSRNPLACALAALESESVGMAKYGALKDNLRTKKLWREL